MNTAHILAFAFALFAMICLPLLLGLLVVRAGRVPVKVVLVAAGFYLLNLAVNLPLTAFVWPLAFGRSSFATLALTCVTWGVCEELARYASFRYVKVMREHRDDRGALAAGIGHGGAESILFGLQFAAGVLVTLLFPAQLPAGSREQLLSSSPATFVLTGLDRLPALAGHLAFAFLIVMAFRRGRRYLPIAIVAHTLVDFLVFGIQRYVTGFWFEAVFALVGAVSLVFVALVIRSGALARQDPGDDPPSRDSAPAGASRRTDTSRTDSRRRRPRQATGNDDPEEPVASRS